MNRIVHSRPTKGTDVAPQQLMNRGAAIGGLRSGPAGPTSEANGAARPQLARRSPAVAGFTAGSYSLSSLLICDGCDQPLRPSRSADGGRVYVFLCGCRRAGIDAGLIERLVRDRVEAASAALVNDLAADGLGPVFQSLFVEVRIGADVEELAYRWRI